MNKAELLKLGRELLNYHELYSWQIGFCEDKTTVAWCLHAQRRIDFSLHFLPHLNYADARETMLHEIAHALVGGGHGHDAVWKAKALSIGSNGNRCADIEVEGPIIGVCPAGHKSYRHKITNNVRHSIFSCNKCCKKFDRRYFITYYRTAEYKRGYAVPINQSVVAQLQKTTTPSILPTVAPVAPVQRVQEQPWTPTRKVRGAPLSRATAYDQGSTVINWD